MPLDVSADRAALLAAIKGSGETRRHADEIADSVLAAGFRRAGATEVYRGVTLVDAGDRWIGAVDGVVEFEAGSRGGLLVEIDDTLPPEPVEEGEPMTTFIPACNRVFL